MRVERNDRRTARPFNPGPFKITIRQSKPAKIKLPRRADRQWPALGIEDEAWTFAIGRPMGTVSPSAGSDVASGS